MDYKEKIINWLNADFANKELKGISADNHIDYILDISDYEHNKSDFVIFGLEAFKQLVSVVKKNGLLNTFVPTFLIILKTLDEISKIKLNTLEELSKNMGYAPPELALIRETNGTGYYMFEEYKYPVENDYFISTLNENYHAVCRIYRTKEDVENNWEYSCYLEIVYKETNNNEIKPIIFPQINS
jgi:hypothetical protein